MNDVTIAIEDELNRAFERTGVYEQIPEDVEVSVPYAINNGLCDAFAKRVIERLDGRGVEAEQFVTRSMTDGIDSTVIDERFWPGTNPPELHRGHVWIYDGTRHYDAECTDGCSTFVGLPLFRRSLLKQVTGTWPKDPPPLSEVVRRIEQSEQKQTISD